MEFSEGGRGFQAVWERRAAKIDGRKAVRSRILKPTAAFKTAGWRL
jgi:hypothetical protein